MYIVVGKSRRQTIVLYEGGGRKGEERERERELKKKDVQNNVHCKH